MTFAYFPPWWLAALIAAAVAVSVWVEYRRPIVPVSVARRATLMALRAATLTGLILCLFRPIAILPPAGARDAVVPVLVDASRSMRISDSGGQSRMAQATALLQFDLLPALSRSFRTVLFSVADSIEPVSVDRLKPAGRRSNLRGGLAAVRDRFRGDRIAGIVLVSDGADTGGTGGGREDVPAGLPPVFAVGVGSAAVRDREVASIAAGDQRLDNASVDLQVSTSSAGFSREPFDLRLLANGSLLERRRIVPPADASPHEERFTVFPNRESATVFTAEVAAGAGNADVAGHADVAPENDTRSVLISPAGRKRRLLVIEGAPGFEHSFLTRAWASDPGLDVDSVVRKGRNAGGSDTFSVQASADRTLALARGFPASREDLFAYDALVMANLERDFFNQAQLSWVADFVSERGGGLLVVGGRSFSQRGLIGTPLEAVLPVELDDRRGNLVSRATLGASDGEPNHVIVTSDGEGHPIMRLGESGEETRKKWAGLPPLSSLAPLGPPRPGATVLAVSSMPGGGAHPVIAVQRYGRGRSMVFGGEASWRWRMMTASTDRSYNLFWRQAARWLSASAPDPVALSAPGELEPGDAATVAVDVRDRSFAHVANATADGTVDGPDGQRKTLALQSDARSPGRFTAAFVPATPGAYHLRVEASRGGQPLGSSERWLLVGGVDREFADPRLNEEWLRRVARATDGRYVRAADASRVVSWLHDAARRDPEPERRDLWHEPWAIGLLVVLLSAEWILRRLWGLR